MQTLPHTVPASYALGDTDWQQILTHKHKVFFSMYVHLEQGLKSEYFYQNSGTVPEEIVAVIFHQDGRRVTEVPPITAYLAPDTAITIEAGEYLNKVGITSFRGSLMFIAHPIEVVPNDDLSQRDYAGVWSSARHGVHIGIGGTLKQNITGEKEKKTYNMFCPAVIWNEERKTIVTFFNHSTEPGYNDSISIIPRLENLKGERLNGKELSTGPHGTIIIDVEDAFGKEGYELLARTGGRGAITTSHKGHVFATLFFNVDRKTNELVSGTHTNPAAIIVYSYGINHPFLVLLAERIPGFYLLWKLKHIRESVWFVNLYPPRPLFIPSLFSYLKQSRWTLQITYLLRAAYLLARRGFRITTIDNVDETGNLKHVIDHNLWANFNIFHFCRARVERLMYLLILSRANLKGKTLSIGPRNEGEILLFYQHGFKDVVGIDLFTYSPRILVMDVHNMTFPDNTFDTINCGWVFCYVYDLPKVIREIVRVSKDGAVIACSYTMPEAVNHSPAEGTDMAENDIARILDLFQPHVDHVFFRDDVVSSPHSKQHLVFRLKK